MYTANLRKVGESVMLAVPPSLLDSLSLQVGSTVEIAVDNNQLVIRPQLRPRYTLDELLDASDYSQAPSAEEREWIDSPAVGRELI